MHLCNTTKSCRHVTTYIGILFFVFAVLRFGMAIPLPRRVTTGIVLLLTKRTSTLLQLQHARLNRRSFYIRIPTVVELFGGRPLVRRAPRVPRAVVPGRTATAAPPVVRDGRRLRIVVVHQNVIETAVHRIPVGGRQSRRTFRVLCRSVVGVRRCCCRVPRSD